MNIDECIGIIPSLCIHLRDAASKGGMELNKETMLPPIYRLSGMFSTFSDECDECDECDGCVECVECDV